MVSLVERKLLATSYILLPSCVVFIHSHSHTARVTSPRRRVLLLRGVLLWCCDCHHCTHGTRLPARASPPEARALPQRRCAPSRPLPCARARLPPRRAKPRAQQRLVKWKLVAEVHLPFLGSAPEEAEEAPPNCSPCPCCQATTAMAATAVTAVTAAKCHHKEKTSR